MITLRKLQKVVEQRTILDIEELVVEPGEIAAIVGPSRSGNANPADDRTTFSQQVGVSFTNTRLMATPF